jgi:hypothetical protein
MPGVRLLGRKGGSTVLQRLLGAWLLSVAVSEDDELTFKLSVCDSTKALEDAVQP